MSTYIKAAIMTLAAVFLAFVFKSVGVNALGMNEETNALNAYSDMMLQARELFLEKNEDFLELSMEIFDMHGLCLRRTADGGCVGWAQGSAVSAGELLAQFGAQQPEELAERAGSLFAGQEVLIENSEGEALVSGYAQVLSVYVSDEEIFYLTGLHELGCVGVAYAPDGTAGEYQSIELVEEWKIFYEMAQ